MMSSSYAEPEAQKQDEFVTRVCSRQPCRWQKCRTEVHWCCQPVDCLSSVAVHQASSRPPSVKVRQRRRAANVFRVGHANQRASTRSRAIDRPVPASWTDPGRIGMVCPCNGQIRQMAKQGKADLAWYKLMQLLCRA